MKKLLIIVFGISSILQSCKHDKAKEISILNQEKKSFDYLNVDLKEQSDYYCKVKINNDEGVTTDYLMSSSNAMKKENILTLFGISLNDAMYEKYELYISLNRVHNSIDPKLEVGTYKIIPLFSDIEDDSLSFRIGESVISEQNFEETKKNNLLHEIEGSYALVSDYPNVLKINDVINLGITEKSLYYTTGKYRVKGEAQLELLSVDTEEKLTVSIDFDVEQEWYLSKKNLD
ncbi:hypothetical protein MTsPCn9_09910 [Croceitalea sp. MTPC9]|uniref:Lipoprotein n=1 Tax=Croceitalea marina TaxID=1775166 RepID=A0ABW5N2E0_9FLAO|nr:hypothetical protein MTsPCn5_37610 [Croceitalea sp. MTPC5]GMN11402.1 hypothetical protein MTsPCn6_27330 [Croceitalea sp. MTPC6]GMN16055.1 hypothetical protein MTsPCn9_09910 [Croceitalea sp. MTPC9]